MGKIIFVTDDGEEKILADNIYCPEDPVAAKLITRTDIRNEMEEDSLNHDEDSIDRVIDQIDTEIQQEFATTNDISTPIWSAISSAIKAGGITGIHTAANRLFAIGCDFEACYTCRFCCVTTCMLRARRVYSDFDLACQYYHSFRKATRYTLCYTGDISDADNPELEAELCRKIIKYEQEQWETDPFSDNAEKTESKTDDSAEMEALTGKIVEILTEEYMDVESSDCSQLPTA